jgi:hypothetical protein
MSSRGPGIDSRTARCIWGILFLGLLACAPRDSERAPNEKRTITTNPDARTGGACHVLPDTIAEFAAAVPDANDLPVTRLVLDPACPRVTVLFDAGARIERAYHLTVDSGHTVIARARGESAPVALAFDRPVTARTDTSDTSRQALDSLVVSQTRRVVIRVMLTPRMKVDPRESRVLLTVVTHP